MKKQVKAPRAKELCLYGSKELAILGKVEWTNLDQSGPIWMIVTWQFGHHEGVWPADG